MKIRLSRILGVVAIILGLSAIGLSIVYRSYAITAVILGVMLGWKIFSDVHAFWFSRLRARSVDITMVIFGITLVAGGFGIILLSSLAARRALPEFMYLALFFAVSLVSCGVPSIFLSLWVKDKKQKKEDEEAKKKIKK